MLYVSLKCLDMDFSIFNYINTTYLPDIILELVHAGTKKRIRDFSEGEHLLDLSILKEVAKSAKISQFMGSQCKKKYY